MCKRTKKRELNIKGKAKQSESREEEEEKKIEREEREREREKNLAKQQEANFNKMNYSEMNRDCGMKSKGKDKYEENKTKCD